MANVREMAKWLALTFELDAATSLLSCGTSLMQDYGFASRDAEPVLVLLATGAEKLLKMTYGVTISASDGSWPSIAVMREYGHNVARLDADCRQPLRDRAHLATASGYFSDLLDEINLDPFIGPLLDTLTVYGDRGRFHNLDHLAEMPQPGPSPLQMWLRLDIAVVSADPSGFSHIGKSEEDFQRVRGAANDRLAVSIARWQNLYFRAWIQGVCGEDAKKHGYTLQPD